MKFQVTVLPQAQKEVEQIYSWIAEGSIDGAIRWYEKFLESLESLKTYPESCSLAPENDHVRQKIRDPISRTRRGNPYRVLFVINEKQVQVLHIRGTGQRLLDSDEIEN
jgi:plasmid stabilization system protein ParE